MTSKQASMPSRVATVDLARVYARLAPVYDAWAALTEARAHRVCLEKAAIADGESVLELAVGTGATFVDLVRANPRGRTEGIDLSAAMLDRARRKVAGLPGDHRLHVGDARRLALADDTFDLVVSSYMFDLLSADDFEVVLAEIRRVLKPGGRVVLVSLGRSSSRASRLWDAIYRASASCVGGCRAVSLLPEVVRAGFADAAREEVRQLGLMSEVISARKPAPGDAHASTNRP